MREREWKIERQRGLNIDFFVVIHLCSRIDRIQFNRIESNRKKRNEVNSFKFIYREIFK